MFQGSGFMAPPRVRSKMAPVCVPGWPCCTQRGSLDVRNATPGAFFKSTVPHGTPKCAKCFRRTAEMEPKSKICFPKATLGATFR